MRAFFAADAQVSQLEAAAEVGVFCVGWPVCLNNSADAACLPIAEPAAQTGGVPGWGYWDVSPPRNF